MKEKLLEYEAQTILKKREKPFLYFLTGAVFVMGAGVASGEQLLPPDITPRKIDYEKEINNPFLGTEKIDFANFFTSNLAYSHRAGNSIKDIDKAFSEGANLFDIDVTEVNGNLYGEHGYVLEDILGTDLDLVFDPAEGEIRAKMPERFEKLVEHIHSLTTPENPLGISIDIKHGNFDDGIMEKIVNTLYQYQVSAIIQPETKQRLDNLREIIAEKIRELTFVSEDQG